MDTGKYHIRNVIVWEMAQIKPINSFLSKKRLPWYCHVQQGYDDNVAKSLANITLLPVSFKTS